MIVTNVLEPLSEMLIYGASFEALQLGARWTAFAEFGAAGMLTCMAVMAFVVRQVADAKS